MDYLIFGLGGVGLFLLGMWLITEGLRVAAGASLSRLLASWTSSRGRGLMAGIALTGLVQSSSAVTVATLGFVNTGLLRFERAVWVIFGCNVGTTLTAWLVAMIGFRFHVDVLALPLIGVGAVLRVFAPADRSRNLGMALAGFGILFLGIQTLSGGFNSFSERLASEHAQHALVWMVVFGAVLTTVMQSSSAATAVLLTALASGMLGFEDAAAAVIGANIGTTSTALLATLGATANARRLAAAHVLFNVITAVVALLLLAPLLALTVGLGHMLGLADDATTRLALFHTLFNVLGVLLMWPLEPVMSRFLLSRFRERQWSAETLQFLDRNVAGLPDAALVALGKELERLLVQYPAALAGLPAYSETRRRDITVRRQVLDGVGDFLVEVSRHALAERQALSFTRGWRIQSTLVHLEEALMAMNDSGAELMRREDAREAVEVLTQWFEAVQQRMAEDWQSPDSELPFAPYSEVYERSKNALLQKAMARVLSRPTLDTALQHLSQCRRLLEQWHRALKQYRQLVEAPATTVLPPPTETGQTRE